MLRVKPFWFGEKKGFGVKVLLFGAKCLVLRVIFTENGVAFLKQKFSVKYFITAFGVLFFVWCNFYKLKFGLKHFMIEFGVFFN